MENLFIFEQPTLGKTEKVIQFVEQMKELQTTNYKQICEANK